MTLWAGLSGTAVLALLRPFRRRSAQLGTQLGHAYAALHGKLNEGLSAIRLIKSSGAEDRAEKELAQQFDNLSHGMVAFHRASGWAQSMLQVGGAAVLAMLVWLAVMHWQMGLTAILPMVALFARALPLLGVLHQTWSNCAHALPAVREALNLINATEHAGEPRGIPSQELNLVRGISVANVTVHFSGEPRPSLERISLFVPARGITVVSGPSGAGKSTLADLIGGLLEADSGQVLVDGVPLHGPTRRAWRERVAYVQQDPILFSATLRDNLRWAAPDAREEQLEEALHAAGATFAFDLTHGLSTRLGDGGSQLSGGERQRLMLARALLRNPALLILDEATSALDRENEELIGGSLKKLSERMAVLVISHKGALLDLSDGEIRLECGRLKLAD